MSECQHALVEGTQILDVVFVANKVVDDLLNWKRKSGLQIRYGEN